MGLAILHQPWVIFHWVWNDIGFTSHWFEGGAPALPNNPHHYTEESSQEKKKDENAMAKIRFVLE